MTVNEVLAKVRELKSTAQTNEILIRYLNEIEGMAQTEVMGIDPVDVVQYTTADLEAELLVGKPHHKMYIYWLMAMVDFGDGEYSRYQNGMQMANSTFNEWAKWWQRTYGHGCGYRHSTVFLSAYGIAVKHGYTGSEEEWLETLKGAPGPAGPQGPKGQDGTVTFDELTGEQKESLRGEKGEDGQRGTGILTVNTAPQNYTTITNGIYPQKRMRLDTIKMQAGVSEVLVGDLISNHYYLYHVYYCDENYAYIDSYESLQGVSGAAGEDGADGSPGADGYTPVKGIDYFDGEDGKDGATIVSIKRTSGTGAAGTTDTYTVTMSDGTTGTFQVYNGADGKGSGDMLKSIYDPNNKNTDIFTYVDNKFKDIDVDVTADEVTFADGETFQQKYDSGELKGADGSPGADGAPGAAGQDGHTPVKGTDYFTEADKQEIVSDVLEAMPDDSDVFYATKNQTTYAEALEAFNAGKLIVLIYGSQRHLLSKYDATKNRFEFWGRVAGSGREVMYLSENGWSDTSEIFYHNPSRINAGTLGGEIAAASTGQTPGNSILRNSKLVSADTTPTVNGEIFWTYK